MGTRTRAPERAATARRRRSRGAFHDATGAVSRRAVTEDASPDRDGTTGRVPVDEDGAGLFLAFLATTMIMVAAITALALAGSWGWLVPAVLIHWGATAVIFTRISRMLDDA